MITIFSILFLNNLLIFIYLKKFSKFINIFDKPDKYLKKHKSNVPLLGGIIILINLMVFFFLLLFFENPFQNLEISKKEYISVFIFIISFFFLGLYDDRFKLNPDKKFVLSIILFIFICYS